MKKKQISRLAWYTIPPIVTYLLFAFISLSFNAVQWSEGLRIAYSITTAIALLFIIISVETNLS